ncbi:TadE/TadG family type IV pilus assembly protein [Lentzea sp. JNUCC 0626]|uniref:TadE/TadG family type IV pilus assembly protein n=1 Tax=Lentzea sp. JNUCC 0626 TaxID=3367513 RepID=UPI00374A6BEC
MSRWPDDRGSVVAETTLLAPLLCMLLVLVGVFVHRGVDARLHVNDAAHQAARAASLERTAFRASAAAQSVASTALSSAGVACRALDVDVATGDLKPGGTVIVTVSCSVDLSDARVLGTPERKRLSSSATQPVDTWRSSPIERRQ